MENEMIIYHVSLYLSINSSLVTQKLLYMTSIILAMKLSIKKYLIPDAPVISLSAGDAYN